MIARFNYSSPLGKIGMQADEYGITEVKFIDPKCQFKLEKK